jgi:hypothetical protein
MTDTHRIAASTAPRGSRTPGSPLWCYQTMNLMRDSYKIFNIDHKRFAQYLAELREHKALEKVPIDCPYGGEAKMLKIELGKRVDEIEAELKAARGELRATKTKLDDQADNSNESRQGQRTDLVYNNGMMYTKLNALPATLAPLFFAACARTGPTFMRACSQVRSVPTLAWSKLAFVNQTQIANALQSITS